MGQKTKGGMWCRTCNKPVMAVRDTHLIRNPLSLFMIVITGGLSTIFFKRKSFVCPTCGNRATRR